MSNVIKCGMMVHRVIGQSGVGAQWSYVRTLMRSHVMTSVPAWVTASVHAMAVASATASADVTVCVHSFISVRLLASAQV